MLSIKGEYEDGKIKLLENPPHTGKFEVIVTFLKHQKDASAKGDRLSGLLSDLSESEFADLLKPYRKTNEDWFKGRGFEV